VPVLDASALIAYLRGEPGAEVVSDLLTVGASISTVNLSEVLSKAADRGTNPVEEAKRLASRGLLNAAITVEPFTPADAIEAARLRPLTRKAGLSLGDRACLALARRMDVAAVTADGDWLGVKHGVDIQHIRPLEEPGASGR
jgi:ribonuclease VapC